MEIAERLGISLRRFQGWEPGPGEAEWDAQERAWMQALHEYRRLLCPCGCGHLTEISQAVENEFRFVVTPVRCHARTAISKEAARRGDVEAPDALMFRAELRE